MPLSIQDKLILESLIIGRSLLSMLSASAFSSLLSNMCLRFNPNKLYYIRQMRRTILTDFGGPN